MKAKRIQVASDAASEQSGLLRYYAQLHSEILQADGAYVDLIDQNPPTGWIHQTKQCTYESCFPTPSPSHNPYLVS